MLSRLRSLRDTALESFWFLPLVMVALSQTAVWALMVQGADPFDLLGSAGLGPLAEALTEASRSAARTLDPDAASDVLSTVAGGMISLVSIVFSLSFVALTLTSQQLGPRVIDTWLRANATQGLLGLSLSAYFTALSGLLALSLIAEPGRETLLCAGLAAALGSLALVAAVVFATRMADAIRADVTVARLGNAFEAAARQGASLSGREKTPRDCAELHALAAARGAPLYARRTGYLSSVDLDALVRAAAGPSLRIAVTARENDFLQPGRVVALALGTEGEDARVAAETALDGATVLTRRRRRTGQPDFEGDALLEVTLRALSPSMNDPFTAMAAIDRIGEGCAGLLEAGAPCRSRVEGGVVRVASPECGGAWLMARLFPAAIRAAADQPEVLERAARRLGDLRRIARREEAYDAVEAAETALARIARAGARLQDEADRDAVAEAVALARTD